MLLALLVLPLVQALAGSRKSLSFRQSVPPAQFVINPPLISAHIPESAQPHDVARLFLREHVLGDNADYRIRDDSYTDQNSGISHIYVRQVVNGLDVVDGNINLNIRDRKVLSFGNSFHNAGLPHVILAGAGWSQEAYCSQFSENEDHFACKVSLSRVRRAASVHPEANQNDPRAAAYFFFLATYPEDLPTDTHLESVTAARQQCPHASGELFVDDCWTLSGLPGVLSPIQARKVYVQTAAHSNETTCLNLAWHLEVELEKNSYEAYVSVDSPAHIIAVVDQVSDAPAPNQHGLLGRGVVDYEQKVLGSEKVVNTYPVGSPHVSPDLPSSPPGGAYRVWKWGINDPESGNRTLEISPYNRIASPFGWHSVHTSAHQVFNNTVTFTTTTSGNNVFAHSCPLTPKDSCRPNGGQELVFDFPDPAWESVEPNQYVNASVTQLFYIANMFHDLFYLYGFDELSGNFQQHNFGKGGLGGDALYVDAWVTKGDNTYSAWNPDGRPGYIHMAIWDQIKPSRDSSLDSGCLIHELSHGLSYRLTGGPSAGDCLLGEEAGALDEGWSDLIATVVRTTHTYSDYPVGAWVGRKKTGLRSLPYSTNSTTNPLKYDSLQDQKRDNMYLRGEIWAEILWVVFNKLVDVHGFVDSLFPSTEDDFHRTRVRVNGEIMRIPKHGNTLMLQLVVNAMKLQPCTPTFIQARDAIVAADQDLTGGENRCLLWGEFGSRGLGTNAKPWDVRNVDNASINGFKVPPECLDTSLLF